MCSCYLITINHQNKETDFRVQLCGILANLRQEKGKRGKKRGGEQGGERTAVLTLSRGKVCQEDNHSASQ